MPVSVLNMLRNSVGSRRVTAPRILGVLFLALLSIPALAQQIRERQQELVSPRGPEAGSVEPDSRNERRIRWLKQATGDLPPGAELANTGPNGKMNSLSRDERRRLRRDILEAGYTAYQPGYGERDNYERRPGRER